VPNLIQVSESVRNMLLIQTAIKDLSKNCKNGTQGKKEDGQRWAAGTLRLGVARSPTLSRPKFKGSGFKIQSVGLEMRAH
jgi:hypothetical protein